jgi:prevent-host-death family protein
MKHVSIVDAETQLSSLVAEAENGREIVITRDGKPVAKLVQTESTVDRPYTPEQIARRRKALEELREIGRRLNINASREQIKAWIEEGRH